MAYERSVNIGSVLKNKFLSVCQTLSFMNNLLCDRRIDCFVFTSLSMNCTSHITVGSHGDGGKQCILVGQDSALKKTHQAPANNYQLSEFRFGLELKPGPEE